MQEQRDRLGCDELCTGTMTSARHAFSLVGAALIGRLSDHKGRRPALLVGAAAAFTSSLLGIWVRQPDLCWGPRKKRGVGGATTMGLLETLERALMRDVLLHRTLPRRRTGPLSLRWAVTPTTLPIIYADVRTRFLGRHKYIFIYNIYK